MTATFGARLRAALDENGPLCVGIDPHAVLLEAWGLPQSAEGVRDFGLAVVAAAAGRVVAVKPQVSFFERFGARGFAALEEVMAAARAVALLVIADAKRGDIGTTNAGYAEAWLAQDAPLEADALTVSPYLGVGALGPIAELAQQNGKGLFVLAATSNPEGAVVQRALEGGEPVARRVAEEAGVGSPGAALGSIGLVIGATVDRESFALDDALLAGTPILAPGFGAQGADPSDLVRRFGPLARNVLANESRSILGAGPEGLVAAIDARAARYREVLGG